MSAGAEAKLNVLLVDDDPVARQLLERGLLNDPSLQQRGIKTSRAGDGKRALAQIHKEMPDAVIVDLFMPRMDGFELARALRADGETEHLPIVFVSGLVRDRAQLDQLLAEVGGSFFPKPADPSAVGQAVLKLLDAATPAPAPVRPSAVRPAVALPTPPPAAPAGGTVGFGVVPAGVRSGAPAAARTDEGPKRPPTMVGVAPPGAVVAPPVPVRPPGPDLGAVPVEIPPMVSEPIDIGLVNAGSLSNRPVPRLLIEHLEAGSTGTLVLRRGQVRKEIFIRDGKPVGSESNLRQEALGSLLQARGILDEEQLTFLLSEMKRRGQKMGAVLVELGWLSPEDVLKYLGAQARKRVVDCLRWTDGAFEFSSGAEFMERVIEHELEIPRLLFVGLQKTAAPDLLLERLVEEHGASPVRLSSRLERYRSLVEEVFGPELPKSLAGKPTVGELALRQDASNVILGLEALALCGLADFEPAPPQVLSAVTPEEAEKSSFSLERLGHETLPAQSSSMALPEIDLGFSMDDSHGGALDVPAPRDGVPMAEMDSPDSGVITIEPLARLALAEAAQSQVMQALAQERQEDPRQVVLREYLEIHGKNLYELLGVDRNAGLDQIVAAYERRTRKFAPDIFAGVDLGADAAKLENIRSAYNRAFKVLCDSNIRAGYDKTLGQANEEADLLGAELIFSEARAHLDAGDLQQALLKLEQAVRAGPDQAAYHAFLGWAQYLADGEPKVSEARERLEHALTLDPGHVDAHEFLGRLAAATGDEDTARASLEKALEADPSREQALDALTRIYGNYSEFHATERIYRRLIRALGDRALPLRRRIWKDLAALYETEFEDFASARIAYEMAARLAPDDLELQRKVVALNQQDLARWKELARALTAEWRLQPFDGAVGSALVDLFLRVGKTDAATIGAAALVLRGHATPAQQTMAVQHRPRVLGRLAQPIEGGILAKARHPGEDADLEALFALLATSGLLAPFSDEDMGLTGEHPLAPGEIPDAFRRVLHYACGVLKVSLPERIFPYEALEGDARLADTRPYSLFVGPALLQSTDTVELGFRLGRAMSFGTPGRIAGSSRSGRQLRPFLMACMALGRKTLSGSEVDPEIIEHIETSAPQEKVILAELGSRLVRDRSAINLSAWARSLGRTATRLGTLICGDVMRVGKIVSEEEGPEALEDFLEFVLSIEHLELREELGISPVV
ncbi:MAG: response regulator [Deltaproteobacteria bacterium]|nr:response regulator [Deltaproteobacteria bacterium]